MEGVQTRTPAQRFRKTNIRTVQLQATVDARPDRQVTRATHSHEAQRESRQHRSCTTERLRGGPGKYTL